MMGAFMPPERRKRSGFLALLSLCGVLFVFLTPPFQVPDEPAHFFRAFDVSEGRLLPRGRPGHRGAFVPESLPRMAAQLLGDVPFHADRKVPISTIRDAVKTRLEPRVRVFVESGTPYSFVPYLPAALGIAVARRFSDSALIPLYAGRLFNLAVSLLLIGGAFRAMPIARPVLWLLSLAPMAVFLMASASADSFTNSFCFFFTAHLLSQAFSSSGPLSRADRVRFLLLSALLGLTKPGYTFLTGLFLLIPAERVGSAARRAGFFTIMLSTSCAAMVAWAAIFGRASQPIIQGGRSEPWKQDQFLLAHPFRVVGDAASDLVRQVPVLANEYIGKLGWVDTRLPATVVLGEFLLLVVVASTCGCVGAALSRRQRILVAGIVAASLAGITALLYVFLTPAGSHMLGSAQGRYFIPLGPPAFLLLSNRRWCINWEGRRAWLLAGSGLVELFALAAVVRRFYL